MIDAEHAVAKAESLAEQFKNLNRKIENSILETQTNFRNIYDRISSTERKVEDLGTTVSGQGRVIGEDGQCLVDLVMRRVRR